MTLLEGRTLVITGVVTPSSIAYAVARRAQECGARVILTGYGRLSLVERLAARLPQPAPVVELDVTNEQHLTTLCERLAAHTDHVDGVLHSVAYAPQSALGGQFLDTPWQDVATTLHVSTYSLKALVNAVLPMMGQGGAVVGLDFDASVAWRDYDWMGVAKAGLESCARYLARYLGPRGIRINLVAAGPLKTLAAGNISRTAADQPLDWAAAAPLGWDERDATAVADTCVALLSPFFSGTTGEIVHVDGGLHAMGR